MPIFNCYIFYLLIDILGANRYDHHTEFVVGLDFNLFVPGEIATASWDGYCTIWNTLNDQLRPPRMIKKPMNRPKATIPLNATPHMVEPGNLAKQQRGGEGR